MREKERESCETRAVVSGPKLSNGEHAVRELECPAREPRLRPLTFHHNTRTYAPSPLLLFCTTELYATHSFSSIYLSSYLPPTHPPTHHPLSPSFRAKPRPPPRLTRPSPFPCFLFSLFSFPLLYFRSLSLFFKTIFNTANRWYFLPLYDTLLFVQNQLYDSTLSPIVTVSSNLQCIPKGNLIGKVNWKGRIEGKKEKKKEEEEKYDDLEILKHLSKSNPKNN